MQSITKNQRHINLIPQVSHNKILQISIKRQFREFISCEIEQAKDWQYYTQLKVIESTPEIDEVVNFILSEWKDDPNTVIRLHTIYLDWLTDYKEYPSAIEARTEKYRRFAISMREEGHGEDCKIRLRAN